MAFVSFELADGLQFTLNTDQIRYLRPDDGKDWDSGALLVLKEKIVDRNTTYSTFLLEGFEAVNLIRKLESGS